MIWYLPFVSVAYTNHFFFYSIFPLKKSGIYVVQFGFGSTYMALAQTNNIVSSAINFQGLSLPYPKLFAWTGKHEEHEMFVAATNITFNSKPNVWAGIRLDFTNSAMNLLR